MRGIIELLGQDSDDEQPNHKLTAEDAVSVLKAGCDAFLTCHDFKSGDLIQQKDGLSSDLRGGETGKLPAIFVRYEEPGDLFDKMHPGIPYTAAKTDCLVGWLNDDGGVVISASCSEAYEPYQP